MPVKETEKKRAAKTSTQSAKGGSSKEAKAPPPIIRPETLKKRKVANKQIAEAKKKVRVQARATQPSKKEAAPPEKTAEGKDSSPETGSLLDQHADITATIRGHAKRIRAAELAVNHDEVRILEMSTITHLVNEAVDEATREFTQRIDDKERARLLKEAEDAFNERLEAFKAENAGIQEQAKNLEHQLERAQSLLEEERNRVVSADQFTVSDAGLVELETRLGRLIQRAVQKGGVSRDIEEDMRGVVVKLLDDEREMISQKASEAQSTAISLLERKVARLAGSLEETEHARNVAEDRANALEAAGGMGLRNVVTAGMDGDDPNRKKKLCLLKELIDGNRELRKEMASAK